MNNCPDCDFSGDSCICDLADLSDFDECDYWYCEESEEFTDVPEDLESYDDESYEPWDEVAQAHDLLSEAMDNVQSWLDEQEEEEDLYW